MSQEELSKLIAELMKQKEILEKKQEAIAKELRKLIYSAR